MKNTTVLQLAEKIMMAHNSTGNHEVFKDIDFDIENEVIYFDILYIFIGAADDICSLLNLTIHIEVNSDPTSDKQLKYYIN